MPPRWRSGVPGTTPIIESKQSLDTNPNPRSVLSTSASRFSYACTRPSGPPGVSGCAGSVPKSRRKGPPGQHFDCRRMSFRLIYALFGFGGTDDGINHEVRRIGGSHCPCTFVRSSFNANNDAPCGLRVSWYLSTMLLPRFWSSSFTPPGRFHAARRSVGIGYNVIWRAGRRERQSRSAVHNPPGALLRFSRLGTRGKYPTRSRYRHISVRVIVLFSLYGLH